MSALPPSWIFGHGSALLWPPIAPYTWVGVDCDTCSGPESVASYGWLGLSAGLTTGSGALAMMISCQDFTSAPGTFTGLLRTTSGRVVFPHRTGEGVNEVCRLAWGFPDVPVFISRPSGTVGSPCCSRSGSGSTGGDPGAVMARSLELVMLPAAWLVGHMLSSARELMSW
jgi:hypothetical protein